MLVIVNSEVCNWIQRYHVYKDQQDLCVVKYSLFFYKKTSVLCQLLATGHFGFASVSYLLKPSAVAWPFANNI